MGGGEGEPAAAGQCVLKPEGLKKCVGQARGEGKWEEEEGEEGEGKREGAEEGEMKYEKGQGQGEIPLEIPLEMTRFFYTLSLLHTFLVALVHSLLHAFFGCFSQLLLFTPLAIESTFYREHML